MVQVRVILFQLDRQITKVIFPCNRVSSLCRVVDSSNMEAAVCGDSKDAEGTESQALLYAVKFHQILGFSKEQ